MKYAPDERGVIAQLSTQFIDKSSVTGVSGNKFEAVETSETSTEKTRAFGSLNDEFVALSASGNTIGAAKAIRALNDKFGIVSFRREPNYGTIGIAGDVAPEMTLKLKPFNGQTPPVVVVNSDYSGSGDFFVEKGRLVRRHGLHWIIAALFIVADMAGGGIVALPTAIVRCSINFGIVLLLLMAVLATSSSILLGKAWVLLLHQYPIYRTHCRKPFAEMGYRALGPQMKSVVSTCLNVTQFGASTVFLILIAKNTDDFFRSILEVDVGRCVMIVVVALVILPVTLLKSPQDFWPVVVLGMITTGVAVLLVCVGASLDWRCASQRHVPDVGASNVLLALGTIMFSYSGHSALPTIQHDMRRPSDFGKSSLLAFTLITAMNLVAVLFGALTYGDALGDSVINSIQTTSIQQAINLMILAHCLLTFTLIINPLNQEVEEYFNVPQGFSSRRVIVRVAMMALAVLMATSVPTFDTIISVIGAVAFMLISMLFPCLFYLYLSAAGGQRTDTRITITVSDEETVVEPTTQPSLLSFREVLRRTRPHVLFFCGVICLVGSVSAAIATVTSIGAIVTTSLETPCYIKPFLIVVHDTSTVNNTTGVSAVTHCCGQFLNMSVQSGSSCMARRADYYSGNIF